MLSAHENLFQVSNSHTPCTLGVDICSHVMPLSAFESLDSDEDIPLKVDPNEMVVGFVDAEGQGDRDVSYDARLACPVLLTSKCVIFNWY